MPKPELFHKVEEGFSISKLAEHFKCSKSTIRYWLNKYNLKTNISRKKYCNICNNALSGNQQKFCSNACKSKYHYSNNNGYIHQYERAKTRKMMFISMLGGKCSNCPYSKNMAALEFHHKDASTKQIKLDSRSLGNHSLEILQKEVSKCVLLCANCHREHHNPELSLN